MLEILPLTPAADAPFVLEEGAERRTILLKGGTAEELRSDAVEALRSLPRRGLEIGGILLGPAVDSLVVNGLAPVESEHLYGPRYEQSERDRAVFQARIDELRRSPADEHVPVGLYRTYTLQDGAVDARDTEAFRRYFPENGGVFLLVSPKLTGRAVVSCFYWDQRSLIPCALVGAPEMPADLPAEQTNVQAPVPPESARPPAVIMELPPAAAERRKPATKSVRWVNEVAIAGIAALVVFTAVLLMDHEPVSALVKPSATAATGRLDVRVESTPDGAKVVWNGKSDAIRRAAGALLSVEDGGNRTEIPISLSELQTGNTFYGAVGPRAKFVLTVYGADGAEIRESVVPRSAVTAPARRRARAVYFRSREKAARESREVSPDPIEEGPSTLTLPPPVTAGSGSIFSKP